MPAVVPLRSARQRPLMVTALAVLLLACCSLLVEASLMAKESKSLYADLGVTKSASANDIKRAFRKLTREHHPDTKDTLAAKEEAKAVMAHVLRAYEVLSDADKRADYDATGFVPGDPVNPNDMSEKELFEHYHQRVPIFSKTEPLESATMFKRLLNFRGSRLFLIQVYDDGCTKCRTYSGAWETLYHSALVSAGIVKMYRIDAKSAEGAKMLKESGIRYTGSEPTVFALLDGERWTLWGIRDLLKRARETALFDHLLEFLMKFFYEMHSSINSLPMTSEDAVASFLSEPRGTSVPGKHAASVRVLFPKINAESLPLAVSMRYAEQTLVRSVSRDALLKFVEDRCEMEVEVYDRRGDVVPMPEFVVVSTETLGENDLAQGAEGDAQAAKCRGVHIGASASLTYEKAGQFVEGHLPPRHPGLPSGGGKPLAYLDSMAFLDVCEKNCVMWVRRSCAMPTGDLEVKEVEAIAKQMQQDYLSFKTGYLCLDEQPLVASYLDARLPRSSPHAPVLIAMKNGDDETLYALTSLQEKSALELDSRDIDNALSAVLAGEVDENAAPSFAVIRGDAGVAGGAAFSTLLPGTPFPLSTKQRLYLMATTAFNFISPFIVNTVPFLLMYLVQTKFLNKNRDNNAEAGAAGAAPANGATAAAAAAAAAPPAANAAKKFPFNKRPAKQKPVEPVRAKNQVAPYTAADLTEAKEGKGFLLILLDERENTAEAMKLPVLMSDPRFSVRVLSSGDGEWREWIQEQQAACEQSVQTSSAPEAEKGLAMLAIRRQRMLGAVKPPHRDMESFLRDLLDGTVATSTPLPAFAQA